MPHRRVINQKPSARPSPPCDSIRGAYEKHGVTRYYASFGGDYRNPHEPAVHNAIQEMHRRQSLDLADVLDLAAGSGEATLALRLLNAGRVEAVDPYTADAYARRTGTDALTHTFDEIAGGVLADRRYTLIVCSFALHLCERSRLPLLMQRLAELSPALLVITPHKRPEIRAAWRWNLVEEFVIERVRARYYLAGD